jgi:CRP-like cAMP-binding protein
MDEKMRAAVATPATAATPAPHTVQNLVLSTLDEKDFELLRPHLQLVDLKRNAILHDTNRPADAVHFIESGVLSRVARTQQDGPVEVAMVGRFGFVGVSVVLGMPAPLQRTIVQVPGLALRIDAPNMQRIMREVPGIKDHLLRYVQLLIMQKAQVSLCHARHEIDKRVARWMLLARDRLQSDQVPVTHDLLASMLGVRRPGVSEALANFEAQDIIRRSRGSLHIVDAEKLRRSSCECYTIIQSKFGMLRDLDRHVHVLSCE